MLSNGNKHGRELAGEQQPRRIKPSKKTHRVIVPIFILSVFALVVAHDKIPAVEDWYQQTFNHKHWQVRNTCQHEALSAASQPAFARVVKPGEVKETQKGYYIDRVVLGEMGKDGREKLVNYSCYAGLDGKVVKIGQQPFPQHIKPSSAPKPPRDD